jgi:hypothetical protein
MEALQLRVKDVQIERGELSVRSGKGGDDRITMLPVALRVRLQSRSSRVRALHERDIEAGTWWVDVNFCRRRYGHKSRRIVRALCLAVVCSRPFGGTLDAGSGEEAVGIHLHETGRAAGCNGGCYAPRACDKRATLSHIPTLFCGRI